MVTKLAKYGGAWNSPTAMGCRIHPSDKEQGVPARPVGEDQALWRC